MTAPLVQRLSLVVDAATGQTETRMEALAASTRDVGVSAQRSAGQVAAAAERVAAAQLKRDDAAGRVRVAEQQLLELQERGNASASRLAAAEERLESARRGLAVATGQVERAQAEQTAVQDQAAAATLRASAAQEQAGAGSERFREQLGGVRSMLLGLGAFQLGDWLRDSAESFLEGARGAQTLALSMNATVAQGGQLSQLFDTLGLEASDLLEIQAEFAQQVGAGGQQLHTFGAELKTNRDGTVNWALTLEDALIQLQKIPDATQRNALGFQLFGEEGYKQLSRLLTSGVSVQRALEMIGTPFSEADIRSAQELNTSMMEMQLSASNLGRTMGRELVPLATGAIDALNGVASIISSVPVPIALATAGAITLGRLGINPLAVAAERLSVVLGAGSGVMSRWSTATRFAFQNLSLGQVALTGAQAGFSGLRRGVGAVTGALGGPFGIAMIGAGVAMQYAAEGSQRLETRADAAAASILRLRVSNQALDIATANSANKLEETAGYWERSAAYVKGHEATLHGWERTVNDLLSPFQRLTMGFGDTADTQRGFQMQIDESRKQLGAFGVQELDAATHTKSLNDMIAEGTTSGGAFGEAVAKAAQAQADQTRTTDTANAALAAYHATTDQAAASVLSMMNAQLAAQDAGYAFLQALDDLNGATDDSKTSVDEVTQAHTRFQSAALRSAAAAADAAVETARAAGDVVTPLAEAQIRAQAMLDDLRGRLNTPGLAKGARDDLQGMIDQLQEAKDKGNVQALVTLTGVDQAAGQLDDVTGDRDTTVRVESRNGPAVKRYLDGLADDRQALIRVDSRNGPAVRRYLDSLAEQRLAIIRVETRNGPAVDAYLDALAGQRRVAVIDVQQRGGGAAGGGTGLAGAVAGRYGDAGGVTVQQLTVQVTADPSGRISQQSLAEGGRQIARQLAAHERTSGTGWRTRGRTP